MTVVHNPGFFPYIPLYYHTIPHRRSSLLIEVSDLIKGTAIKLKRLREDAKGKSTSSSDLSSSDLSNNLGLGSGGGEEGDKDVEV